MLGLLHIPAYVRYARVAVVEGRSESRVIRRHTLPNALLPILTVIGLSLPALVGSSVLVEQVFAWPGIGTLSIQSALYRDYPDFMATALLYAAAVRVSSLVTDLAYMVRSWLAPGITLTLIVLSVNDVSETIKRALDPHAQTYARPNRRSRRRGRRTDK